MLMSNWISSVFIEHRNLLNGLIPDRVHFVEFAELRPKVSDYFCEVEHRSENDLWFCAGWSRAHLPNRSILYQM